MGMVIPVIRPLLRAHLDNLDYKVQPGISTLTWHSMNIDSYLHRVHSGLTRFEELLNKINELIEHRIEKNLKTISKTLLVDVRADATYTLDQFVGRQEKLTKDRIQVISSHSSGHEPYFILLLSLYPFPAILHWQSG